MNIITTPKRLDFLSTAPPEARQQHRPGGGGACNLEDSQESPGEDIAPSSSAQRWCDRHTPWKWGLPHSAEVEALLPRRHKSVLITSI